jgi:cytochrome b pre-mRNA-processing protein 3
MWDWLRPSPDRRLAEAIHAAATAAARRPELYGSGRIPDSLDGRFEAAVLHAALALDRLQGDASLGRAAQIYVDIFFRSLDGALREVGVGDLSVPRRMRTLAGATLGRFTAYRGAFADGVTALTDALTRNIWNGIETPFAADLANWTVAAHARFAAAPPDRLGDEDTWPPLPV